MKLPSAATLNLEVGELPACRSSRLPDGLALVLEAKIKALPLDGLPEAVTFRLLPVALPALTVVGPDSASVPAPLSTPNRLVTPSAFWITKAALLSVPGLKAKPLAPVVENTEA